MASVLARLAAAACLGLAAGAPQLRITQRRSIVFSPGDCDTTKECFPFFRIPAIKRTKSGALIAFVEARGGHSGSSSDHGDVQIVARISKDGTGRNGTWGDIYKVAHEDKHTIGNPSPVVDFVTGTIFCHFAQDNTNAFVTQSTDEGKTWSARVSLNNRTDPGVKVPGSGWYGSGVGGGTQLGSGKMIILSEERKGYCDKPNDCKPCTRSDHCLTTAYNAVPVFSADHGKSWQRGSFLQVAHNSTAGPGEPSVSLLGNSSVDLVMSGRGADHQNSYSISNDGGVSFHETQLIAALESPGCQSPVTGMYNGTGVLLTSPVGKARADLQVFHASSSSGLTDWKSLGTLWPAQAGYSSLLAGRSLLPKEEAGRSGGPGPKLLGGKGDEDDDDYDYLVLFEGGFTSSYQYTMLIRFSIVDTVE
eukprot:COSAG05_NODE_3172_length_2268_cov_2.191332_1_plen_419_part_00